MRYSIFDVLCALSVQSTRARPNAIYSFYTFFNDIDCLAQVRNVFKKNLRSDFARRTLRLITSFVRLYFNQSERAFYSLHCKNENKR